MSCTPESSPEFLIGRNIGLNRDITGFRVTACHFHFALEAEEARTPVGKKRSRLLEREDELPSKATKKSKPKAKKRDPTPLQRFRRQTLARKRILLDQQKKCQKELREIARDLGVLKRRGRPFLPSTR